jgi:hypothetical protein
VTFNHYGTLEEAGTYFANRLHEEAWTAATDSDHERALIAATRIIDTLNYKGSSDGPLEFPRGDDTEVPEAIRIACYEIAHSLLDGKDPELELENLGISSQGLASVRTTFNRSQVPIEHIVNGVPNATAWRLLRPFLRDKDAVKLLRIS